MKWVQQYLDLPGDPLPVHTKAGKAALDQVVRKVAVGRSASPSLTFEIAYVLGCSEGAVRGSYRRQRLGRDFAGRLTGPEVSE